MGLGYSEMYNISGGVYFTFNNKKANKRMLSVKHNKEKRDKLSSIFPTSKYQNWTRENFIIACLYINFKLSPSSFISSIEMLKDIEQKEIFNFKNEILQYNLFLKQDLEYLVNVGNLNLNSVIKEYKLNNIKWYTLYFYILAEGKMLDILEKTRVSSYLARKIKKLLLYVTFSDKSITKVRTLIKSTINI